MTRLQTHHEIATGLLPMYGGFYWAMDVTPFHMARRFIYVMAVVDWFCRKVLTWRQSVTLETELCLEALIVAMARYGKPEIMSTDQGRQFASIDFIKALKTAEIHLENGFRLLRQTGPLLSHRNCT